VSLLLCPEATPGDYVYLGCVADQDDLVFNPKDGQLKPGTPGLPSLLLVMGSKYMAPTTCASAAKRAGKRFFGLQRHTCRAGPSLINALRHSARPGVCNTWCAPDFICRGGGPLVTSLYAFKAGKGELSIAAGPGSGSIGVKQNITGWVAISIGAAVDACCAGADTLST
jgi:hypothetical protein